eukprot:6972628-Prymnesium_polylepis.1
MSRVESSSSMRELDSGEPSCAIGELGCEPLVAPPLPWSWLALPSPPPSSSGVASRCARGETQAVESAGGGCGRLAFGLPSPSRPTSWMKSCWHIERASTTSAPRSARPLVSQ